MRYVRYSPPPYTTPYLLPLLPCLHAYSFTRSSIHSFIHLFEHSIFPHSLLLELRAKGKNWFVLLFRLFVWLVYLVFLSFFRFGSYLLFSFILFPLFIPFCLPYISWAQSFKVTFFQFALKLEGNNTLYVRWCMCVCAVHWKDYEQQHQNYHNTFSIVHENCAHIKHK